LALTPGTRLGVYQVIASIGEGGMGQVYRATDTTLSRQVAIKILPDTFASDPDRLARFEREAKTLASLNHPHIAAIYGFEKSAGVHALVMELVEGEDLSAHIARGPIPLREALPIARQIADALEAAHEQGIVHRDLKPANIKLRADGTVKVLDFGLAKAAEPAAGSSPSVSISPTLSLHATQAGMILGTAAYMSPEQAKGKAVDKRADIWAFGCVLYEMLSARRPFAGDDVAETLAFVLTRDPDWLALPVETPASLRTLLRRCLEKDARRRLRDIGDALPELSEPLPGEAPRTGETAAIAPEPITAATRWLRRAVGVAVVVGACALTAFLVSRTQPTRALPVTRFALTLPSDQEFTGTLGRMVALSPDGTRLAYVANNQLYARQMAERAVRSIPGTDAVRVRSVLDFAWSPDGQFMAFVADGALKKIPVSGGATTTICAVTTATSLDWGATGILFVGPGGIMRASPDGGTPERIAAVADESETVRDPQMLPDGRTVLFSVASLADDISSRWEKADIVVQTVPSGARRTVLHGGSEVRYVPTGHLVYASSGNLMAVPFDASRQQTMAAPVGMLEGVRRGASGDVAQYSVSATGTLVYLSGPAGSGAARRNRLVVVNVHGGVTPLQTPEGAYEFPRFSPDGTRLTFDTDDGKDANVWVYELSGTSPMRRLTFGGRNRHPIWSRDGRWIAFQSDREGDLALFRQRADGTGAPERLTTADRTTAHVPQSWSADDGKLLFTVNTGGVLGAWTGPQNPGSSSVLMLLSMQDRKVEPFAGIQTRDRAVNAEISPDGSWVAYSTGDNPSVVYAQPFPPTGAVYQVSRDDDGHHPWWSHDGRELFYVPGPDGLVRVSVSARPSVSFGSPVALPRAGLFESPVTSRSIDGSADGQRLVGVLAGRQPASANTNGSEIEIVLNWAEELKRLAPVK
jgi:serine/threonine-protein kinase